MNKTANFKTLKNRLRLFYPLHPSLTDLSFFQRDLWVRFMAAVCFLKWFLGERSIRVFGKFMGDPYYPLPWFMI